MNKFKLSLLSCLTLSTFSLAAQAAQPQQTVVIAPSCLATQLTAPHQSLASANGMQLLALNDDALTQLMHVNHKRASCGGFKNVTESFQATRLNPAAFLSKQYKVSFKDSPEQDSYRAHYPDQVNALLKQINPDAMWSNLTTLTSMDDRYANSDHGIEAANWLKSQIETLASAQNRDDISVRLVPTGRFKQPSVVVKIGTSSEPGIVIGGHMDTLESNSNSIFGSMGLKPGADDDGSGTVTTLETARTLITSGMHFKKPIYIIWYAAEEEGLVGSQYVVKDFQAKKIAVSQALQLDMTGYAAQNDMTMWLINDYVNMPLTNFLKELITTYVKRPVQFTRCGYQCSDHATWNDAGIPSSFPFESADEKMNPAIHSSNDTMEKLSLEHMTDYVKLALAYAVELAEPADIA